MGFRVFAADRSVAELGLVGLIVVPVTRRLDVAAAELATVAARGRVLVVIEVDAYGVGK